MTNWRTTLSILALWCFPTLLLVAPALAGDLAPGQPIHVKNRWGQIQLEKRKRQIREPQTVQKVIDGNTIRLASGEKVRLIGVNAPERKEPLGPMATQCLKDVLGGQRVRLELGIEPKDRYGRLLAHVFTEDGQYVNVELLRRGCAKLMVIGANTAHLSELLAAQEEARKEKRGVWRE